MKNNFENQYISVSNINFLQFDNTSKCNLSCKYCARTSANQLGTNFPQKDIPLNIYLKLFSEISAEKLEYIQFNGNYGDPVAASNFFEVIEYLVSLKIKKILINTNGSLRSKSFWIQLAKVLSKTNGLVIFSIDGMSDTSHIYRRGSSWEKIMENVQSFIRSGGKARWDYIIFDHNKDQIEEAKNLSKNLGFVSFRLKKSNRSVSEKIVKNWSGIKSDKDTQGHLSNNWNNIIKRYSSINDLNNVSDIKCKFQSYGGGIFIDFDSKVWPCCWIAAGTYMSIEHIQRQEIEKLYIKYGKDFNSLNEKSLSEIILHKWLNQELVDAWTNKNKLDSKLWTCTRTCGLKQEYSSGAPENFLQENFKK